MTQVSLPARVPPWIVGIAIIAVLIIALLLFFSDRPFTCTKTKDGYICGFINGTKFTHEKFLGYFYDWDEKRNTYCSSEVVDLEFSDDEVSIQAKTTGKVKDRDGGLVERSWNHRGYKHGNNIAIAYVTDRKPTTGNGVYYLVQSQGDYAGFWIGTDWPSGKTIRCPYVLTKTEKRGSESCEERWPYVFSPATVCQEVFFQ